MCYGIYVMCVGMCIFICSVGAVCAVCSVVCV